MAGRAKELADAELAGVLEVGLEVSVVGGGDGVPAFEQKAYLPLLGGRAEGGAGRRRMEEFSRSFRLGPNGRWLDGGVVEHGLIAAEVEPEDHGRETVSCGNVEQQAQSALGSDWRCDTRGGVEGELDLLADGQAIESVLVVFDDAGVHDGVLSRCGRVAKEVVLKQAEDLWAALGGP